MEENWLDGNGMAGLLQEATSAEMTSAMRRCPWRS